MQPATSPTGRPFPPPGKTLPKNRPALLTTLPAPRPTAQPQSHQPTSTVGAAEISPAREGGEMTARSATPFAVPFPRSFRVAVLAPSPDRTRPLPPPHRRHAAAQTAPLDTRAAHRPAARRAECSAMSHCYIPVRFDNRRRSPLKINRQPARLESSVTHTKQTPATPFDRQLFHTFARASQPSRTQVLEGRRPQVTNHGLSNRHTSRLQSAVSSSKQTIAPPSNRHFFAVVNGRFFRPSQSCRVRGRLLPAKRRRD